MKFQDFIELIYGDRKHVSAVRFRRWLDHKDVKGNFKGDEYAN